MNKLGLVLEGGGAKGAYQIGAYRALLEHGFEFDYVMGASIGAINGAMFVQDNLDLAESLWREINYSNIFELEDHDIDGVIDGTAVISIIDGLGLLMDIIKNKGLDTSPLRQLLEKYIDENKIRKSDTILGFTTVNLTEKRPVILYIDDIEEGNLVDYLLATSSLILFRPHSINGSRYLDGGYYMNNPYKPIIEKCDYVIDVILKPYLVTKNLRENEKVKLIIPSGKLGGMMDFNQLAISEAINMGYKDAISQIEKWDLKEILG